MSAQRAALAALLAERDARALLEAETAAAAAVANEQLTAAHALIELLREDMRREHVIERGRAAMRGVRLRRGATVCFQAEAEAAGAEASEARRSASALAAQLADRERTAAAVREAAHASAQVPRRQRCARLAD